MFDYLMLHTVQKNSVCAHTYEFFISKKGGTWGSGWGHLGVLFTCQPPGLGPWLALGGQFSTWLLEWA